jgi:hypothetical protein
MRHPALRRSARHSKRDSRPGSGSGGPPSVGPAQGGAPSGEPQVSHDPAGQNRIAPDVPPDGEHNQGGVRPEGIEYQRDLGSEQDA